MTYYYSIWDLQTNSYMATGSNSRTKHEAMTDILDYLTSVDFTEEEIKMINKNVEGDDKELESFLGFYEFRVERHEGKIDYDR